jgi:hypothetical protein
MSTPKSNAVAPLAAISAIGAIGAIALLAALVSGCGGSRSTTVGAGEGASTAPSGEAARTQELEQKADDYQARMQAIQSSDMSAEEKVRAANALVDEQQQTIQQAVEPAPADPNAPPN